MQTLPNDLKELNKFLEELLYSDKDVETLLKQYKLTRHDENNLKRMLLLYGIKNEYYLGIVAILNKDKFFIYQISLKELVEILRAALRRYNVKLGKWEKFVVNKYNFSLQDELLKLYPDFFTDAWSVHNFIQKIGYKNAYLLTQRKQKLTEKEQKLFTQIIAQLSQQLEELEADNANTHYVAANESESIQEHNIFVGCARIKTDFQNSNITQLTQRITQKLQTKFTTSCQYKACENCIARQYSFVLFDEIIGDVDRINDIDVLFIGMNPYKDEVKECVPFIGKAGQELRAMIRESALARANVVFCNSIPCFLPNNADPNENMLKTCSPNLIKAYIKYLKPRVIITLGKIAEKAFAYTINKDVSLIEQLRWKVTDLKLFKFCSTYHPSYVANYARNKAQVRQRVIDYFDEVARAIGIMVSDKKTSSNIYINKELSKNDVVSQIKDLTAQGYLPLNAVKAEYDKEHHTVVLKLVNENGQSEFVDMYNYPYEFFVLRENERTLKNYKPLYPLDQLIRKTIPLGKVATCSAPLKPYQDTTKTNNFSYEADLPFTDYAVVSVSRYSDFKYLNPALAKVLYYDIEVASENEFPDEKNPKLPVISITAIDKNNVYVFVNEQFFERKFIEHDFNLAREQLLEHIPQLKQHQFILKVGSEYQILREFFNLVINYDILAAWNIFFDTNYIGARWKAITNDEPILNNWRAHRSYRDGLYHFPVVSSYDLLEAYRFAVKGKENYTLDFIAREELGLQKVEYDEKSLVQLVKSKPAQFLQYNMQDTALIYLIDKKYGFTELQRARACASHSTFFSWQSTTTEIDTLLYTFARKRNMALRTRFSVLQPFDFVGGFVRRPNPVKQTLDWILCYDVGSMYPNIIRTFNISPDSFVCYIKTGPIKESRAQMYQLIDNILNNANADRVIDVVFDPFVNTQPTRMTIGDFRRFVFENNYILTLRGTVFKQPTEYRGLFAEICDYILKTRKQYKELAKKTQDIKWELLSTGIKILNNSLYGVMGNEYFRFFNPYMIESVTFTGQTLIKLTSVKLNDYLKTTLKEVV